MPQQMPEFAMPPEPDAPAGQDAPAAVGAAGVEQIAGRSMGATPRPAGRDALPSAPEPDAWEPPGASAPTRRPWRQLLAATLIGVLLGAGLVSAVQGMERAAGDGDRARLTEAAMAYLTAIAEGRATDAGALVPVEADGSEALLTDAVLSAAGRITEPSAGFAQIEGEVARIEVGFRLGRVDVSRTLEAVREGGDWRITTSLVERVTSYAYGPGADISLAGVPIEPGEVLLYPALYMTDANDDGFFSTQSITFSVDGDSRTAVEIAPYVQAAPGLAERLEPVALAYALACQARAGCSIPAGELGRTGEVQPFHQADGAAEVSVYIARTQTQAQTEWHEVRMRGDFGADAATWECGTPSFATGRVEAWEACAP